MSLDMYYDIWIGILYWKGMYVLLLDFDNHPIQSKLYDLGD